MVTSGLLATLDRRELTGVVAHEVAHIRNRDSRVILVGVLTVGAVVTLATAVTALAVGLWRTAAAGDQDEDSDSGMLIVVAALLLRRRARWCGCSPSRRRS